MAKGLRTLIVGAGVAGLALAAALRRAGLRAEVAERRAETAREGAGVHLAGNAVRVLERLGVADALRARAFEAETIHYANAGGETLFRVDLREAFPAARFLGAHRADLREALLEAAGRDAVRFGRRVTDLVEGDDGVEALFDDGARDEFDLVVGADGVASSVRGMILPDLRARPFEDYWSWRFVLEGGPALREPTFWLGVDRTLLLYPIGAGRLYCGAGPIRVPGEAPAGDRLLPWLRGAYADFPAAARDALASVAAPEALSASRIWSVHGDAWHRGRVLLVGDAAHACPPTLAQGAALALEDAWVLAELLSEGGSISGTLAAFERRRRPRVEAVQEASTSRMTVTQVAEPSQLAVRDALLRRIGADRLVAGWRPLIDEEP